MLAGMDCCGMIAMPGMSPKPSQWAEMQVLYYIWPHTWYGGEIPGV